MDWCLLKDLVMGYAVKKYFKNVIKNFKNPQKFESTAKKNKKKEKNLKDCCCAACCWRCCGFRPTPLLGS